MSFDFFSVLQPHTKTKRIQTPFQVFEIIFFCVQMWNVITTTYRFCCCHFNILMSFIFFAEKKKEREREREKNQIMMVVDMDTTMMIHHGTHYQTPVFFLPFPSRFY